MIDQSKPLSSCPTTKEAEADYNPVTPAVITLPDGTLILHREFAMTVIKSMPMVRLIAREAQRKKILKSWDVRTLSDALASKLTKPPAVIEGGLLLQASGALVAGQPQAMKSYAWLQAAIEAATKHTVWGAFGAPDVKRTLYIEIEDPAWMVEERVQKICRGLNISKQAALNSGFNYAAIPPFGIADKEQELENLIWAIQPDFMVISTLQGTLKGENMQSQQDMAPIMQTVLRLCRKCPTVLLTHSPRNKTQKRAYGAVTQDANFATILHFAKDDRGKKIIVTLDSKAAAGISDFEIRPIDTANNGLRFECTGTLTGVNHSFRSGIMIVAHQARPRRIKSRRSCRTIPACR